MINSVFYQYTSSGIIPPEHLTFVSLLSAKGLYSQGIEWNTPGRRRGEGRAKDKIIALWTPCLIPKKWKWSIKKGGDALTKSLEKVMAIWGTEAGQLNFPSRGWGWGVVMCPSIVPRLSKMAAWRSNLFRIVTEILTNIIFLSSWLLLIGFNQIVSSTKDVIRRFLQPSSSFRLSTRDGTINFNRKLLLIEQG